MKPEDEERAIEAIKQMIQELAEDQTVPPQVLNVRNLWHHSIPVL